MQVKVNFDGFPKRLDKEIAKQRRAHLHNTLQWLKSEAQKSAPRASGAYAQGYKFRTFSTISGKIGEFYNDVEYASYASNGRGSGRMPPDQAIRDWCKRKGIPESAVYPIRKKIAEKGTQQHQKKKSHIGIDYQGNIKPGGLVDQANRKFEDLVKKFRIV